MQSKARKGSFSLVFWESAIQSLCSISVACVRHRVGDPGGLRDRAAPVVPPRQPEVPLPVGEEVPGLARAVKEGLEGESKICSVQARLPR